MMSDKGSINNITLPVYKKLKAECSVVRTETGITELSDAVLSKLKCGDIVCKEDSSGKHSYIVSFKKDGVGICLTYSDGSGYIETVSYDWNNTTKHWVYNSTDVFNAENYEKKSDLEDDVIDIIEDYPLDEDITITGLSTGLVCYYAHARVSNGKLNIVLAFNNETEQNLPSISSVKIGEIQLTEEQWSRLYTYSGENLSTKTEFLTSLSGGPQPYRTTIQLRKIAGNKIYIYLYQVDSPSVLSGIYDVRFEFNFLLS